MHRRLFILLAALSSLALAGCDDSVQCGTTFVYDETLMRCACAAGLTEIDGTCVPAEGDAGTPPGSDAGTMCVESGIEICDGRDNDCTGGPDDTFACIQGTATECTTTCGTTGTATCASDCTIPPTCTPPTETCNATDDDCDGLVDEGVLAFGDAVDWTALGSSAFDLEEYDGGFVVTRIGATGVEAQLLDARGQPIGELVTLVADTAASVLDTTVEEGALFIAYGTATTSPAGQLRVLSAELPDLTVRVEPRTIASPADLPERIQFEKSFYFMIFYQSAGVRVLASSDLATGTFRDSVVVGGSVGNFDVVADDGAFGRAFVAYSQTPAGESDYEIFVQAVGLSGAEGDAERVTDNVHSDDYPRIAHAGGRAAVIWTQQLDDTSLGGTVRLFTGRPTAAAWIERSDTAVTEIEFLLRSYQITARAGGWLLVSSDVVDSATVGTLTAHVASADGSVVGFGGAMLRYVGWAAGLMTRVRGVGSDVLVPVTVFRDEEGMVEGRVLSCAR
ncbi:MAG: hypothetical protein M3Y87_14430 [Myxococcota bacterium]|nr:hypothetical protein [Myxococcota bacterium]